MRYESNDAHYNELFSRNIGIITEEDQQRLRNSCIGIAGVGGVGGIQLVTLARAGVGAFHIADPSCFGASDRNRQYGALESTLGKNKADVMSALVRDINPDCRITTFNTGINAENITTFIEGCDVIVDAIEFFTIEEKIRLYATARKLNKYVFTSPIIGMGASLLVFAPDGMTFEEYMEYNPKTNQFNAAKFCPIFPEYVDPSVYQQAVKGLRPIPSNPVAAMLSGSLTATELLLFMTGKRLPVVAPQLIQADMYRRSFDIINDQWSDFWSEFSQEAYDYIALLPDNNRMLDRVAELSLPGIKVLDAGCGTGNLTLRLANQQRQVTAIDFSEGMVKTASAKTRQFDNVTVTVGNVTHLDFPDESFDAVTSVNVLFNIEHPEMAIREMCRVLKPNGKLVISSPLKDRGLSAEHRQRVLDDCIAHNIDLDKINKVLKFQLRLLAGGGFKYLPTEDEIQELLLANGFKILVMEEAYYKTNFLIEAEKCQVTSIQAIKKLS